MVIGRLQGVKFIHFNSVCQQNKLLILLSRVAECISYSRRRPPSLEELRQSNYEKRHLVLSCLPLRLSLRHSAWKSATP